VFETEIRLHVALKETAKAGRSILEFDPHSPSAKAYRRLASEVLQACGDAPATPVEILPAIDSTESLLDLPILVAPAPEAEQPVARPRVRRAEAPQFENFVVEGWQRWLGASS
jgi:hypothetical protein